MSPEVFIGHIMQVQGACKTILEKLKVLHVEDPALLNEIDFILDSIDLLVTFLIKTQQ
jgi:hypothetical protein